VDLDRYPVVRPPHNGELTLGWTGSHSTLPFLQGLVPVLQELARKRKFRLVVISHTDRFRIPELPVEVVSRKWRADTEAADLADIDIGLAPFPDTGWTPWRCHGKVLQYMAAGLPVVASNMGIIPDYIDDGRSGFLAQGPDEWVSKIGRLMDDPDLRRTIALRARQIVKGRFSAEVWAPRVGELIRQTVEAGRR
jgi:glycosyltransferase involved in cell wall biosynthesis